MCDQKIVHPPNYEFQSRILLISFKCHFKYYRFKISFSFFFLWRNFSLYIMVGDVRNSERSICISNFLEKWTNEACQRKWYLQRLSMSPHILWITVQILCISFLLFPSTTPYLRIQLYEYTSMKYSENFPDVLNILGKYEKFIGYSILFVPLCIWAINIRWLALKRETVVQNRKIFKLTKIIVLEGLSSVQKWVLYIS